MCTREKNDETPEPKGHNARFLGLMIGFLRDLNDNVDNVHLVADLSFRRWRLSCFQIRKLAPGPYFRR